MIQPFQVGFPLARRFLGGCARPRALISNPFRVNTTSATPAYGVGQARALTGARTKRVDVCGLTPWPCACSVATCEGASRHSKTIRSLTAVQDDPEPAAVEAVAGGIRGGGPRRQYIPRLYQEPPRTYMAALWTQDLREVFDLPLARAVSTSPGTTPRRCRACHTGRRRFGGYRPRRSAFEATLHRSWPAPGEGLAGVEGPGRRALRDKNTPTPPRSASRTPVYLARPSV